MKLSLLISKTLKDLGWKQITAAKKGYISRVSLNRIVKDKKSLLKYLNGMPEKIEDCSEVKEFEDVLIKSKQIIFSGPPGTGKTHYADLLAKCFTKNPKSLTMTFRSAAIQILSENGKPMHYTEIWKQALNQKLVQTDGKTPQETLRTKIAEDMKRNGSTSIFKKTDIATYDINQEELDELKIIESNESEKNPFVESVTFHPSYSYEEFKENIIELDKEFKKYGFKYCYYPRNLFENLKEYYYRTFREKNQLYCTHLD